MRRRSPQPKPPAFQLYVRDWLSSTLGMARELKGLYVDLLCWSWDNGPLPDDAQWRQRVIGGSPRTAARLWTALRSRWRLTAHGWINPRLERQRRALATYTVRASKAARARWEQVESDRIRPHATSMAPSTARGAAKRMLRSTLRASAQALPDACSSSASSSASVDQEPPAAPPPVCSPPFKVYCAIAGCALEQAGGRDLGVITEAFKSICGRQQVPYDSEIARKAIDAVIVARSRRRA